MIDVVIAGAGPNGLMLACELSLSGIRPVVVDPLSGPNPAPRANGIAGQGVRILDHRGLYEALSGEAGPPRPAPGHMFAAFPLNLTTTPESQLYRVFVPQPKLVSVLAHRAAEYGTDIRWGHVLTGFKQDADGVRVQVDGPDGGYELTSRYLVGADGGTSVTRKLAGIDFPGTSSDDVVARMAFDVLLPDAWVDTDRGSLDMPNSGPVPQSPFVRTERGVLIRANFNGRSAIGSMELDSSPIDDRTREEQIDDGLPMTLAELQASVERVVGVEVPLRLANPDGRIDFRRFVGINSRIASRYRSGRVLLVGDAAHVHSALGGPGLNLGLQDAVNLGWKLVAVLQGRIGPELLDTYESERRPAAERVIMHSRAQLALIRPGSEVTALRQLLAELLDDPDNVRRLGDLLSGADYRLPTETDAHPLVGYWVPDLALESRTGTTRIAELARDGRPVLIDLTAGGEVAAATSSIADRVTVAAATPVQSVPATALLVRPDGYVAWASSSKTPEVQPLHRVLRYWFGISALGQSSIPA